MFDRLWAGLFGAYLSESKVQVVFQLRFQILTMGWMAWSPELPALETRPMAAPRQTQGQNQSKGKGKNKREIHSRRTG
jgi:hypothetical protein